MTLDAMHPKAKGLGPDHLTERFQEARDDMRQLDEVLRKLGPPPKPQWRLDRAPMPVPTIPIFNPTILSY